MKETSHSEVPENHNNLEITKIAKEEQGAIPCVPPRLAWLQNINESGCHQLDIHGNNGTFFQKLSAMPIHLTGMFFILCSFKGVSVFRESL